MSSFLCITKGAATDLIQGRDDDESNGVDAGFLGPAILFIHLDRS